MIILILIITTNAFISSCKPTKSNKNNKKILLSTQEDIVPITSDELVPEDKIRKNDSRNISVLQNYERNNSRYINS